MPALLHPPLLLITARRQAKRDLMETVAAALAGGCRWISVREKDLPPEDQIALARAIERRARPYDARVMIHGSADLAREAGLDAVHLPTSGDVQTARKLLSGDSWVSVSTHDADEARRASELGADAVTLSPIFPSVSKPAYGLALDLDGLEVVATMTQTPVIALGGVNAGNAGLCLVRGAKAVAVMGGVMRSSTPASVMAGLIEGVTHGLALSGRPLPRRVHAQTTIQDGTSMTATDHLKFQACEDWNAAVAHAFIDALANGSLEPDTMAGYLQQDYLFIDEFVRLLASVIAHAPTLADSVPATQFLAQITGPENTYFLRSFEALEIPAHAPAAPETRAFQDLMTDARLSGRYETMLAVLVVAEWIYLDWASTIANQAGDLPFWLGEWIILHSGEEFESVVAHLRGQLDAVWEGLDLTARIDVQRTFCKAVRLERAFFDAAWRGFPVER